METTIRLRITRDHACFTAPLFLSQACGSLESQVGFAAFPEKNVRRSSGNSMLIAFPCMYCLENSHDFCTVQQMSHLKCELFARQRLAKSGKRVSRVGSVLSGARHEAVSQDFARLASTKDSRTSTSLLTSLNGRDFPSKFC